MIAMDVYDRRAGNGLLCALDKLKGNTVLVNYPEFFLRINLLSNRRDTAPRQRLHDNNV